jgi:hypothetical protein
MNIATNYFVLKFTECLKKQLIFHQNLHIHHFPSIQPISLVPEKFQFILTVCLDQFP